jgi:hypothetical protein
VHNDRVHPDIQALEVFLQGSALAQKPLHIERDSIDAVTGKEQVVNGIED